MSPGPALTDGRLRLDEISPATGDELAGGRCLLLPPVDEVAIEGSPPADAGRLLIVVRGDAVLGRPGETLTLSGGLVVRGHLEVRGPVVVEGSLHAGSLSIEAPMEHRRAARLAQLPSSRRGVADAGRMRGLNHAG